MGVAARSSTGNLATTTATDTDMEVTTHKFNDPHMGILSTVPQEIRYAILAEAVPPHYKQIFTIDHGDQSLLLERTKPCCHGLAVFYTSKPMRKQTLEAVTTTRTITIKITENSVISDFVLVDPLDSKRGFNIPRCKSLHLMIQIPHPRSAPDLTAVRRNVETFVLFLSHQKERKLPLLEVSLDSEMQHSLAFSYDDYAMLLGPLAWLRNTATVDVTCQTDQFKFGGAMDPTCLRQCQLIQASMLNAKSDPMAIECMQQQVLIDLKLELALYRDQKARHETLRSMFDVETIGVSTRVSASVIGRLHRILSELRLLVADGHPRINTLRKLRGTADKFEVREAEGEDQGVGPFVKAEDLNRLQTALERGKHNLHADVDDSVALGFEVFDPLMDWGLYKMTDYHCWASGHLTRVNPFW